MQSETHGISMPKSAWIYPLLALVFYFVAASCGFAMPFVPTLGNASSRSC